MSDYVLRLVGHLGSESEAASACGCLLGGASGDQCLWAVREPLGVGPKAARRLGLCTHPSLNMANRRKWGERDQGDSHWARQLSLSCEPSVATPLGGWGREASEGDI